MGSPLLALKKATLKLVCSPPFELGISSWYRGVIPFRGLAIDTSNELVPKSIAPRLYWKFYERAEVDFVEAYLRPDIPVVELGSCIGVVACCIVKKKKRKTKLVSVEANPRLREVIIGNLNRNGLMQNVEVVTGAIDYSGSETIGLVVSEDAVGTHVERGGEIATTEVPALQLNGILTDHGIDSDFALVCDIESAEADIVQFDADALAKCQQIIMEFHPGKYGPWNTNFESLKKRIESLGFEVLASRGDVLCFERKSR